jgi:hypothetical protein
MGKSNAISSPLAFSSRAHMSSYDISRLVRIEFHRNKDLYSSFSHTAGLDHLSRRHLALSFLRSASQTVAAEEAVLLPLLRQYPEDVSAELVERAAERRAGLKKALEQLDASSGPSDAAFDGKVERAWVLLSAGFHELDQKLLPQLDRHCPLNVRERHGRRFFLFRTLLALTRAHAWAPSCSSIAGLAVNAAMAPLDWARDLVRFGPAMPL